jgi:hypothetical protein
MKEGQRERNNIKMNAHAGMDGMAYDHMGNGFTELAHMAQYGFTERMEDTTRLKKSCIDIF